jgi:hypothetical protein
VRKHLETAGLQPIDADFALSSGSWGVEPVDTPSTDLGFDQRPHRTRIPPKLYSTYPRHHIVCNEQQRAAIDL